VRDSIPRKVGAEDSASLEILISASVQFAPGSVSYGSVAGNALISRGGY